MMETHVEAPDRHEVPSVGPVFAAARFVVGARNATSVPLEGGAVLHCVHGRLLLLSDRDAQPRVIAEGEDAALEHTGAYVMRSVSEDALFSVAEMRLSRAHTGVVLLWIDPSFVESVMNHARHARSQALSRICGELLALPLALCSGVARWLRRARSNPTPR